MVKTRDQASPGSSTDGLPAARTEPGSVLQRMGRLGRAVQRPFVVTRAPAAGTGSAPGTTAARPKSDMSRFFTGMMAYVIGSFLLQYLLGLAYQVFKLNPRQVQTLFPRNTPFVGTMTTFAIIYLLLLVLLIWALYRFNIMPRDLLGARRAAAQRAAENATTSSGSRSRSRRRRGTGTSASATASTTTHAASTTRRANASLRPQLTRASDDGTSDAHYERVKALQRGRRRKR